MILNGTFATTFTGLGPSVSCTRSASSASVCTSRRRASCATAPQSVLGCASVSARVRTCANACACSSGCACVSKAALQLFCQLVVLLNSCQLPGVAAQEVPCQVAGPWRPCWQGSRRRPQTTEEVESLPDAFPQEHREASPGPISSTWSPSDMSAVFTMACVQQAQCDEDCPSLVCTSTRQGPWCRRWDLRASKTASDVQKFWPSDLFGRAESWRSLLAV